MNLFQTLQAMCDDCSRWVAELIDIPQSSPCSIDSLGINPSAITIAETWAQLVLTVPLSQLDFAVFDIQATETTVLIWGQRLETTKTKGSCPGTFENWILLPSAVLPETLSIKTEASDLSIRLAKQFPLN